MEQHKNNEDPTSTGRRELIGYGRNIFMGYLNKENDNKVKNISAFTGGFHKTFS